MSRLTVITVIGLSLGACATSPAEAPIEPNYSAIVTDSAPLNAHLYADCFEQAARNRSYQRAHDGGGDELILFTCSGEPARAFYEALGPWSARLGSEFAMGDRTARSTARVRENLYGVDYCSALADADHRCVISFNAGDFLDD